MLLANAEHLNMDVAVNMRMTGRTRALIFEQRLFSTLTTLGWTRENSSTLDCLLASTLGYIYSSRMTPSSLSHPSGPRVPLVRTQVL